MKIMSFSYFSFVELPLREKYQNRESSDYCELYKNFFGLFANGGSWPNRPIQTIIRNNMAVTIIYL